MSKRFFAVGGDRRQTVLAALLAREGRVWCRGVPERPDELPEGPVDVLILPCPAFSAPGLIRTEAGGLPPAALKDYVNEKTKIVGGALASGNGALSELPAASVTDLLLDPAVCLENARLTAEACLVHVMQSTERSLYGRRCLVLGYGRIGACLSRLLRELGAQVVILARSPAQRALARTNGLEASAFDQPLPPAELVFNTVPAPALPGAALASLGAQTLWVELASKPGGLPEGFAPAFRVLGANNLPGRILPVSAAEALYRGILRLLRESADREVRE